MNDPIPDSKLATWVEEQLGESCPQWLCEIMTEDLWDHWQDMLFNHADVIAEARHGIDPRRV